MVTTLDAAVSRAANDLTELGAHWALIGGHLIALKVLARRGQNLTDLDALLEAADETDTAQAREAVALIAARGFDRGQDIVGDLEQVLTAAQEH